MDEKKNNLKSIYYGCCPICKAVLIQAQNGLDGYIRCSHCNNYVHLIIRNNTVSVKIKPYNSVYSDKASQKLCE